MKDREEQRKLMFLAFEKQKKLIKKRDLLLNSKNEQDKNVALSLTHEIARLEDFIRTTENKLRMTD
ncbi:MAG: hypothetical protein R3327_07495 [Nitrosopumilaceae archaeon]|nr:hypothetical protein [Nitrosopumilaceae archaeon]